VVANGHKGPRWVARREPLKPAETLRADEGFEEKIASWSIGFCLIRQSSGIPIVCFQQSKETLAHIDQ